MTTEKNFILPVFRFYSHLKNKQFLYVLCKDRLLIVSFKNNVKIVFFLEENKIRKTKKN